MRWTATGTPTLFSLALEGTPPRPLLRSPARHAPEKLELGSTSPRGSRYAKLQSAHAHGRLETRKNLRHQPPGGPSVPTPPLVRRFQKLTHSQGVQGAGRTGFPAGSPGGPAPAIPPSPPPRLAPQDRRAKGRPKDARPWRPLRFPSRQHTARPESGRRDTDTDTHRTALAGERPKRPPRALHFQNPPRGQLCKFPLDLSFS